jgi:nitroreductase
VELGEAVRRRRMVRRYSARPVPKEVLDRVLRLAVRAPSAGFSQGVDLLVLEGPQQTRRFFEVTSDQEFLANPQAIRGLLEAPVIILPIGDPSVYVARYAEADKSRSSLAGLAAADWPTPYWLVDASFMVMLILLAAADEGLGALFFHLHRDPAPLLAELGVPDGKQLIGAVALGYEAPAEAGRTPTVTAAPAVPVRPGSPVPEPSGVGGGEAGGVGGGEEGRGSPGRRRRRRVEDVVHLGRW